MCIFEKHMNSFHKKYSECKDCNRTIGLERCNGNKDKISKQQKQIMKKIEDKYFHRNKRIDVFNIQT